MNLDGKPEFLSVNDIISFAKKLVSADEITKALDLLNNPPTYFQNDQKIEEEKKNIYSSLMTIYDYAKKSEFMSDKEIEKLYEDNFNNTKNKIDVIVEEIKRIKNPSILDINPGSYWIPSILNKQKDLGPYLYYGMPLLVPVDHTEFKNINIFICMETIEHLWAPEKELQHWFYKYAPDAESIILSTPQNSLGGGSGFRDDPRGHVRTYSIQDLIEFAYKAFPKNYEYQIIPTSCQIIVGRKKN